MTYELNGAEQALISEISQDDTVTDFVKSGYIDLVLNHRLNTKSAYKDMQHIAAKLKAENLIEKRIRLGQYIARNYKGNSIKDWRFVNGYKMKINCYSDVEQVKNLIGEFILNDK